MYVRFAYPVPSPTMAAAIRESIIAASEVPAATSIKASACAVTGVCSSSSAIACASPALPASTAKLTSGILFLSSKSFALSTGTTITCALLQ